MLRDTQPDGELKPLILTDTRVLIADLFVGDVGSTPAKLTADEIAKETGRNRQTVDANMRALPLTGWFRLDWEDIDPYDFTRLSPRRRIFLNAGARDPLALCLQDFRQRRSGKYAKVRDFQVEYVPPRMNDGEPAGAYVPLATWDLGGALMTTARARLLIYCFDRPEAFYHASEISTALSLAPNTAGNMLRRCEDVGLMVSEYRKNPGARDARVFKLNEKGVAAARSVAERRCH